jgi:hypothetical protein
VKTLFVISIFLNAGQFQLAFAVDEEVQIVEKVLCSLGKEVRRLEVLTHGRGCVLNYVKIGKSEQIALAQNGVDLCRNASRRVSKKLENSGFKCN